MLKIGQKITICRKTDYFQKLKQGNSKKNWKFPVKVFVSRKLTNLKNVAAFIKVAKFCDLG